MASWQKRARIGVAIFGVVFGGIVYSAIRERAPSIPPEPVRRVDPKAIAETYSAILNQLSGGEQPYEISADRVQQYEDGSTRLFGVRVTVRNRGGRDFVITSEEAYSAKGETDLRLTGNVKVAASDGFELTAAEATFDQNTGVARSAGEVSFRKGRMRGSGVGMAYDQPNDILRFDRRAHVIATDDEGNTALEFTAGAATLDRPRHVLYLEKTVHAVRGAEVIDAASIVARLAETDDIVTYLELRGDARVAGSGAFDSMSARDIDLDYTDGGETLERVLLDGNGSVATKADGDSSGRRMSGGRLELHLATDGSLTRATGQSGVRVELPAVDGDPPRTIDAETFDAAGAEGKGLTAATFTSRSCAAGAPRESCVAYREAAAAPEAGGRNAYSQRLVVSLAEDAVTGATFTGNVSFEERGFTASATEGTYAPGKRTLLLSGGAGRRAHVEEEQITVDARTIDVGLDARSMTARGDVETVIRGGSSGGAAAPANGAPKMPRLLKDNEAAQVSGDLLEYAGSGGRAVYSGHAILSQGASTTIRAHAITLDRETGNLTATGEAVSRLVLDKGSSVGRAHDIRYDDASRTIAYSPAAVGPTNARGGLPAPAAPIVQLNVPDGDITAQRIEVLLGEGRALERLEAYRDVTVTIESRIATGARLTIHSATGQYVMAGAPGAAVRIWDRGSNSCTTGSTVTFFKDGERMTVDGQEFMRTQTKGGGPCGPAPVSR